MRIKLIEIQEGICSPWSCLEHFPVLSTGRSMYRIAGLQNIASCLRRRVPRLNSAYSAQLQWIRPAENQHLQKTNDPNTNKPRIWLMKATTSFSSINQYLFTFFTGTF